MICAFLERTPLVWRRSHYYWPKHHQNGRTAKNAVWLGKIVVWLGKNAVGFFHIFLQQVTKAIFRSGRPKNLGPYPLKLFWNHYVRTLTRISQRRSQIGIIPGRLHAGIDQIWEWGGEVRLARAGPCVAGIWWLDKSRRHLDLVGWNKCCAKWNNQ